MFDRSRGNAAAQMNAIRASTPEVTDAEARLGSRLVVAGNVQRLRVQRGWTQTQLAAELGVKQPRVAEIESARANVQLDTIDRLARVFGVEPSALLRTERQSAPHVITAAEGVRG
jgi:ribosome-binding protein aMBF1 (putative translation factor)